MGAIVQQYQFAASVLGEMVKTEFSPRPGHTIHTTPCISWSQRQDYCVGCCSSLNQSRIFWRLKTCRRSVKIITCTSNWNHCSFVLLHRSHVIQSVLQGITCYSMTRYEMLREDTKWNSMVCFIQEEGLGRHLHTRHCFCMRRRDRDLQAYFSTMQLNQKYYHEIVMLIK